MIDDAYSNKNVKSGYHPPPEVVELTKMVQKDYAYGHDILTRTWVELNNYSVIDDENNGQLMFNAFVDTGYEDPNESWKWRGTRSMARNKGIAMHANITANFLYPAFVAQNEEDDIDEEFSEVMRDIVEWMTQPNVSNYQSSFLQVAFGMMTNPVTYLGAEFFEVYQTIKQKQQDGTLTKKQILDEVLSGFQAPVYSATQILITNAYERNIQKQRAIIKRRFVEKSELEAKYGDHPNWQYVKAGWKTVFSAKDALFYDIYDIQHPLLVEEVIWSSRREDAEVPFLGGIYLGDEDVGANPIQHRDNQGAPKYNVIPFGYSRIGQHFFYYKSMMNILRWDNMLYDAMTELIMNRAMLEVDMPLAVSGSDKIDSDMVFPKAVIAFEDEKTKVTPLLPASNLGAGFQVLSATEKSMSDEGIDPISSGAMPSQRQQAYVLAAVQANAKKIVAEVAKSLAESMGAYGDLMKDIAINHYTSAQVEELVGGGMRLKYKSFMLENKTVGGKTMNKRIMFDDSLVGAEMTDEEKNAEALKLLEETGWPDSKQALIRVNPEMFAKFNYLARVDVQELFKQSNEYWQPILTNLVTTLAMNPFVDQEGLTRRLMRSFFNSEGDSLIKKQQPQAPAAIPPPAPGAAGPNEAGRTAQSRALSTALPPLTQ